MQDSDSGICLILQLLMIKAICARVAIISSGKDVAPLSELNGVSPVFVGYKSPLEKVLNKHGSSYYIHVILMVNLLFTLSINTV